MSFESEIYNHLSTNFSGPTFGWTSENVHFRPQEGVYYITPVAELIFSQALEIPIDSSAEKKDYIFGLNIISPKDQGTSTIRSYINSLRTLYSKKSISTTNYNYFFDILESKTGYIVPKMPEHFETPISISFTVYS